MYDHFCPYHVLHNSWTAVIYALIMDGCTFIIKEPDIPMIVIKRRVSDQRLLSIFHCSLFFRSLKRMLVGYPEDSWSSTESRELWSHPPEWQSKIFLACVSSTHGPILLGTFNYLLSLFNPIKGLFRKLYSS